MAFLSLDRDDALDAYAGTVDSLSADGTVSDQALRFSIDSERQEAGITTDVPSDRVADFRPLYETLAAMGIAAGAGRAR